MWPSVADGVGNAVKDIKDGAANIYYGIAPRVRRSGTGKDVVSAGACWVDEITVPWPPGLPPASAYIETSPGKHQLLWFLDGSSEELGRIEALNEALGYLLGGDRVWNRDRIFRLPGFINVKYSTRPRSTLVDLIPATRYGLDELEEAVRRLPITGFTNRYRSKPRPTSEFDPHHGRPLNPATRAALEGFLTEDLHLRCLPNGRYAGPCPFPHADGGCDCPQAFYISPVTGQWFCFCSDHLGVNPGTVASGGVQDIKDHLNREIPGGGEQPDTIKGSQQYQKHHGRLYLPTVEVNL